MTGAEQANKIRDYAGAHPQIPKATLVVAFCENEGIECRLSAAAIEAGMRRMPYWLQGVEHFLDFALACTVAIKQEPQEDVCRLMNQLAEVEEGIQCILDLLGDAATGKDSGALLRIERAVRELAVENEVLKRRCRMDDFDKDRQIHQLKSAFANQDEKVCKLYREQEALRGALERLTRIASVELSRTRPDVIEEACKALGWTAEQLFSRRRGERQ